MNEEKILDYILKNINTPNPQILKNFGANEELINYCMYTPQNTNINLIKTNYSFEEESAEVLFESELNFVLNPLGASAFLGSSDVKNNIFDKLSDNDNIRITINNHSITGTISSKESSDGYSTTKYSNLIDTSYCDRVQVTWDHYGQSKSASLEINIQDTAGTYNVKIEKL